MSEIAFLTTVGAPSTYEPLYVSVFSDEEQLSHPFDPVAAAEHAKALADTGSTAAQFVYGHMLLSGQGVGRDAVAALGWFRRAAGSGRADAINMVGRCYECGWGTPVDRAEAARWFRIAADKADAWGMFNLGMLTLGGDGVPADPAAALSLFVRSARLGNAKSMNMIGQYCEDGLRGAVKRAAAQRWYRRAAERGCYRGQYNFARMLAAEEKLEEAGHWLRLSLARAPAGFCGDVGQALLTHPDARLRAIGRDALARANACAS